MHRSVHKWDHSIPTPTTQRHSDVLTLTVRMSVSDIIVCLSQTQNNLPFLLCLVCNICEKVLGQLKKNWSQDSDEATCFEPPEYERVGFGMVSVNMYVDHTSTWMVEQIIFIFRIQGFIHCRSMSGEYEHSSSKSRDMSEGPSNHTLAIFLKMDLNNFYKISVI